MRRIIPIYTEGESPDYWQPPEPGRLERFGRWLDCAIARVCNWRVALGILAGTGLAVLITWLGRGTR